LVKVSEQTRFIARLRIINSSSLLKIHRLVSPFLCALALATTIVATPLGIAQAGDAFTTYGDVGRYALPVGAAALATLMDDTEGLKQLVLSSAVTMGATYGLKYAVNDMRPNGGARSFPSGHTSFAFTGAAYVYKRYGWKWGVPAEIAAAAVAYSRVDANAHRWRDVLASAALAHVSTYFLVDRFDAGVSFVPFAGERGTFGLAGVLRF
jgi:membrane-associated phospholipid phosphatase